MLPPQGGQFLVDAASRAARPRRAAGHQRLQGARLHLVVARQGHPQSLGRLARGSHASQDFEDRRRQELRFVPGLLTQPGPTRRVP